MKGFVFAICLMAGLSHVSLVATAAVITFDYTATDGIGTVTGTFGYDNSVIDTIPAQASFGSYPGAGFLTGAVSGGVQDGAVFNFAGLDWFVSDNNPFSDVTGILNSPNFIRLEDLSGSAFNDDSLQSDLDLADFDTATLALLSPDIGLPTFEQVFYSFTSIERRQVAVSEPATAPLLAIGLLSLLACARRRKAA